MLVVAIIVTGSQANLSAFSVVHFEEGTWVRKQEGIKVVKKSCTI